MPKPHVMLVAGESSGDQLGAALMDALRAHYSDIDFSGVGGSAMRAAGLRSRIPMEEIGLFGVLSILHQLPRLLRHLRSLAMFAVTSRPDVIVLIDIPDFNHRLARRIRACWADARIIAYCAPTIWGWRRGRARKMRHLFDHVMALFPFEPEIFAMAGGLFFSRSE